MEATYISTNSFSVIGDKTDEFLLTRRLKLDCGTDGIKYAAVVTSVFTTVTTVIIDEDILTSNLVSVLYGVVKPGQEGNLPNHTHSSVEGDGGYIAPNEYTFLDLIGTPSTYSGTEGLYLQSTGSGITFVSVDQTTDYPSTISGTSLNIDGDATITGTVYAHIYDSYSPLTIRDGGVDVIVGNGVGAVDFPLGLTVSGAPLVGTTQSFLNLNDTPSAYPIGGEFITINIDSTYIDTPLVDFPLLLNISEESGINSTDLTKFFTELAASVTGDDFTTLDDALWTYPDIPSQDLLSHDTANGRLRFNRNEATALSLTFPANFKLIGDYDVQIDFGVITIGSVHNQAARLSVGNNTIQRYAGSTNGYWWSVGGVTGYINSPDALGKLRITRTETSVSVYSWSGTAWTLRATNTDASAGGISNITLGAMQQNSVELDSWIDNFQINSGTVIWPEGTHPNRKKIIIKDSLGGQCYTEIETWDHFNKKVILHTKVPFINSVYDTAITLLYDSTIEDNVDYVGDTGSIAAQAVWDSNFKAIYHMAQDPSIGTGCILDSTSNNYNGTPSGGMTSDDLIDGLISKAIDFDGTDDLITITDQYFNYDIVTLEVIAKSLYTGTSEKYAASNVQAGGYGLNRVLDTGINRYRWTFNASSTYHSVVSNSSADTSNFDVLVGRYDQTIGNLFVNGIKQTDSYSDTATITDVSSPFCIGCNSPSGGNWQGPIEEVRLSNIARSDTWLIASKLSMTDALASFTFNFPSKYLSSNSAATGLEFRDVSELLALNFTDLQDVPSSYGSGAQYLRTTTSGIEAINGIILKAPDNSEWLLSVTNSGTLYTTAL